MKYIQVYRDAIPGTSESRRIERLSLMVPIWNVGAILGGVVLHGFCREFSPEKFERWSAPVRAAGLDCLASFGLDRNTDTDGTLYTGAEKGALMAEVANHPFCSGIGWDAEGAWDEGHDTPTDPTDLGDALDLVRSFQSRCKRRANIKVFHQPWWKPQVHGGFPMKEFQNGVDWVCPQPYCNLDGFVKAHGTRRAKVVFPAYEKAWKLYEEKTLAPAGLLKKRFPTIQGHGWDGIFHDLVKTVIEYEDAIIWSAPFPKDDVKRALGIELFLHDSFPDKPRSEWVRLFQARHNLNPDGIWGPMTNAMYLSGGP